MNPPEPPPLPVAPPGEGTEMENLAQALGAMGEGAIDLDQMLGEEIPEEKFTRGDQSPAGYYKAGNQIEMDPVAKETFAQTILEMLDLYDSAMAGRWEREREIETYYALAGDPISGGTTSDAEHIVSELLLSQVDQATARIVENVVATEPLIKADPVVTSADEDQMERAKKFAKATQRFLNSFGKYEMRMDRKLPIAIHRACKVGTAVLHQKWVENKVNEEYWGMDGDHHKEEHTVGTVELVMPRNRDVIVYPIENADWQDSVICGHRAYLTKPEWRDYAVNTLGLTEDEALELEISSPQGEEHNRGSRPFPEEAYFGAKRDERLEELVGQVVVTNLYINLPLPGEFEAKKLNVILNETHRKIIFISENRQFRNTIPYHPLRYKIVDDFAWGLGVGDEVVYNQATDSALRNLQIDNIMSGAFHLVQVRAGTMADVLLDRPLPGQVVPVDNPGEDIHIQQMGGTATGIDEAVDRNRFYARESTGLAPVLGGQGDPTMKSGAGTGSTMALIEQAGKKFGMVDRTMRADLSDAYVFTLELVTQYASDGLFYRYVSDEDAELVQKIKYMPSRGLLLDNIRIWAQAPNAATSHEGRRQGYMVAWQFLNQHYQLILQAGAPIFMQTNPTGWQRYSERVIEFLDFMGKAITEHQDLPGVVAEMPDFPELTEPDQQMAELTQALEEMGGQLEQAQMQIQEMQQPPMPMGPGGPPMPMGPGGPPPGGPPGPPPGGMM